MSCSDPISSELNPKEPLKAQLFPPAFQCYVPRKTSRSHSMTARTYDRLFVLISHFQVLYGGPLTHHLQAGRADFAPERPVLLTRSKCTTRKTAQLTPDPGLYLNYRPGPNAPHLHKFRCHHVQEWIKISDHQSIPGIPHGCYVTIFPVSFLSGAQRTYTE